MNRLRYVASAITVTLGLALAPAAMAAGPAGGGFGGHFGGFAGGAGGIGAHIGGFRGEHGLGGVPSLGAHPLDGPNLAAGRGFAGGGHIGLGDGFAGGGHVGLGGGLADGGRHDLGNGIALDGRSIGGEHLMYGRVEHWGRGGIFLGYTYPDPGVCYQYPEYYNPAVGCYGLSPLG